ncbi:HSP 20 HSP20 [Gracilaria domingensis]|nr:HSP 20 HSP20 [Gracilaria domingensis]
MALSFARSVDPFFPFTSSRRELRRLFEFAEEMESTFDASDAVEHLTPNYRYHRATDGLRLEIELPGVAKEHIEIEINGSTLSITGQRFKAETAISEDQNGGDEQKEGKDITMADKSIVKHVYKLRVKVGDNVDKDNVKAEHRNGVLNMYVPFKGDGGVRKIAITES